MKKKNKKEIKKINKKSILIIILLLIVALIAYLLYLSKVNNSSTLEFVEIYKETGKMNLYNEKDTSSTIIGSIEPGEYLIFDSDDTLWYYVCNDKICGWLYGLEDYSSTFFKTISDDKYVDLLNFKKNYINNTTTTTTTTTTTQDLRSPHEKLNDYLIQKKYKESSTNIYKYNYYSSDFSYEYTFDLNKCLFKYVATSEYGSTFGETKEYNYKKKTIKYTSALQFGSRWYTDTYTYNIKTNKIGCKSSLNSCTNDSMQEEYNKTFKPYMDEFDKILSESGITIDDLL